MKNALSLKTAAGKTKTVYAVMIEGWGDREDVFYNCGTHKTRKAAEAALEAMLVDWEDSGCSRDDVVWEIEELAVKK
jgi:hypothetical protein